MIQLDNNGNIALVYHVDIDGGKILNFPRDIFEQETASLSGRYELRLVPYSPKRTHRQGAVYHWFIRVISEETGMPYEAVSRYAKCRFLPIDPENVDTSKFFEPFYDNFRNISELSQQEYSRLLDNIRLWAMESLSIHLPIPDNGIRWKPKR